MTTMQLLTVREDLILSGVLGLGHYSTELECACTARGNWSIQYLIPRPLPDFISQLWLRDKIWEWPGDEAKHSVLLEQWILTSNGCPVVIAQW